MPCHHLCNDPLFLVLICNHYFIKLIKWWIFYELFELNYNSILEFTESEQLDKNIVMGIFVNFRKFWGQNANKQKFPKEPINGAIFG